MMANDSPEEWLDTISIPCREEDLTFGIVEADSKLTPEL